MASIGVTSEAVGVPYRAEIAGLPQTGSRMWKITRFFGVLLLLCGDSACVRPIPKEQAVVLLSSALDFTHEGSNRRLIIDVTDLRRADRDEPYNYYADVIWRLKHPDQLQSRNSFRSTAEFAKNEGRGRLLSFTDEKHRLVQIGSKLYDGPSTNAGSRSDKYRQRKTLDDYR